MGKPESSRPQTPSIWPERRNSRVWQDWPRRWETHCPVAFRHCVFRHQAKRLYTALGSIGQPYSIGATRRPSVRRSCSFSRNSMYSGFKSYCSTWAGRHTKRQLGSAPLDVFEDEPVIDPQFLELVCIFLQSHRASGTIETQKAIGQQMRDNLTAHIVGQPLPTPFL